MIKKKFPRDVKTRKKLAECLADKGWDPFDICLLIGYSTKKFETKNHRRFNTFQTMIYHSDEIRLRMVNFYLEQHDIRAEISKC